MESHFGKDVLLLQNNRQLPSTIAHPTAIGEFSGLVVEVNHLREGVTNVHDRVGPRVSEREVLRGDTLVDKQRIHIEMRILLLLLVNDYDENTSRCSLSTVILNELSSS